MHVPTADAIARAFDFGPLAGDLVHIRRGDTDTWRLDTDTGRYFIKGYRSTTDGQFTPGGLLDQLERAMAFERHALEDGVDMAEPVLPSIPDAGWLTLLDDRFFRAYRWVEPADGYADPDVQNWLGRTMAHVHGLEPLDRIGLPEWWHGAVQSREAWTEVVTEAERRGKAWAGLLRERLPYILEVSSRVERLCRIAPDCVATHGDFKTHNIVVSDLGPVLVDWDSVRVDSAALEAGRAAHIFGGGQFEAIATILGSYTAAGGEIEWAGQDLFASVLRHDLQVLFQQARVSLGQSPAAHWMGDVPAIERETHDTLQNLPGKVRSLDRLAMQIGESLP